MLQTQPQAEKRGEEQQSLIGRLHEAQNCCCRREKMASTASRRRRGARDNPVGFATQPGTLKNYVERLLDVIDAYEACEAEHGVSRRRSPPPGGGRPRLSGAVNPVGESREGLNVKKIVQTWDSPRGEWQVADIHKGPESTLNVV
jgi:hypothetical protein